MFYLWLDILMYSLTKFNSTFIILFFMKKRRLWEVLLLLVTLFLFTRKYLYYLVVMIVLYLINRYLRKYLLDKKYLLMTLNFFVFVNWQININYLLTYLVFVLITIIAPYNLLGEL